MSDRLREIAPGLWSIHHRQFRAGGLRIGTRTNVMRLGDGSLALHAPGPLDDAACSEIRVLGKVSVIVAPNLMHHMFLAQAAARFPGARLLASPGISAKQPGLRIDEVLSGRVPDALSSVAEMDLLEGCPNLAERVFFLGASRTLLAVDLAFHLHGMTGLTRLAMWINAANDRFTVSRLARSQFIADPTVAGRSVARMLERWDFDRIVVSHGDVLESGGRAALRAAWAFAL